MTVFKEVYLHVGADYAVLMFGDQTTDNPLATLHGSSGTIKRYGRLFCMAPEMAFEMRMAFQGLAGIQAYLESVNLQDHRQFKRIKEIMENLNNCIESATIKREPEPFTPKKFLKGASQ